LANYIYNSQRASVRHQTFQIMWVVYSLLAALSAAVVIVLSKAGIKNIDSSTGFAVQSVLILIVSWSVVFSQGHHKELAQIEGKTWLFLILAGIVTCVSSLLSFRALKLGDASQVSSFDKISLVFSIILAVIFLKEKLSWQIVLGGLMMAGGAVVISLSSKEN